MDGAAGGGAGAGRESGACRSFLCCGRSFVTEEKAAGERASGVRRELGVAGARMEAARLASRRPWLPGTTWPCAPAILLPFSWPCAVFVLIFPAIAVFALLVYLPSVDKDFFYRCHVNVGEIHVELEDLPVWK